MKTAVRLAIFLFLFSAPAYAQSNPYMPRGQGTGSILDTLSDEQKQQLFQNLAGSPEPQSQESTASDYPEQRTSPLPPDYFQERSQQVDNMDAIARERADREIEIKALKDAFDTQIHDMQRRIDVLQSEIDNTRSR